MRRALCGTLLFVAACIGGEDPTEPHQKLPYVEDGNLQLYVSNQSFAIDPVDIRVRIDGQLAVEGDFLVENQHSWHVFKFEVPRGAHRIDATSVVGEAELTETVWVSDTRYPVLDYWYYPPGSASEPTPRQFTLYVFDEPPLFD